MRSVTNLELGDIAKDRITGFTGVVVAKTFWINGCIRLTLQPQKLKKGDGSPIDNQTFDCEQLEVVKQKVVEQSRPHGGPMPDIRRI